MTDVEAAPTRDAATVAVLRDGPEGPEVLLVRRHRSSGFAASAWVFPGGVVDTADRTLDAACWRGPDPAALADRLGTDRPGALGHLVAAVRETFEEAGLLIASRLDGSPALPSDPDVARLRSELIVQTSQRRSTGAPPIDMAAFWRTAGICLDLGALAPWSRWVTPAQEPKRYDTRFFVARAPADQLADSDDTEITDTQWLTPSAACELADAGDLYMIFPTRTTLSELQGFTDVESVLAAGYRRPIRPIQPHVVREPGGVRIIHPDDPDYPHDLYRGCG